MGNCLVLEEKVITVMKTDGKILEFQAPIKAQQVLSDFSGHAIADSFSGSPQQHLRPDAKLHHGQLYYLVPVPSPSQISKKKKVRFSNAEMNHERGSSGDVVRIKLIISKQELQELLQKGVSVQDMVSDQIRSKGSRNGIDTSDAGDRRGWKPVLESIAEVN